jgi:porin
LGSPFEVILSSVAASGPDNLGIPSAGDKPAGGEAAACPVATPPPPPPFGGPCETRPKLTGDWGGLREQHRADGFTFDISATGYYQGITSGGVERGFLFGGRNDYLLNVDGQKAGLWQGLSINVHGETVYGDSVNLRTGAIVPVNIGRSLPVVDRDVTALTALKVTQALSDNLLVYAGKINTVDNLQQPFMPGRGLDAGFMNGAFVFNPVLGRTIPYSTFGAGAAVLADGYPVFTLTVFDTNDASTRSVVDNFFDNGAIIYPTVSLPTKFFGLPGHQTVWGAYSSGRYDVLAPQTLLLFPPRVPGLPPTTRDRGSWWADYRFDQAVWVDPADQTRSWGVFGDAGISDGKPNPVRWALILGIGGSSPLPDRKLDSFGIAYYYMALSDRFKTDVGPVVPLRDERGVEVFYNVGVTPWCHITGDLQLITPTLKIADTALLLGLRAKIDF